MSMEPDVVKIPTTLTPQKGDVEQYDDKKKGKAIQLESPSDDGSSPESSNSLLDPDSLIYEEDDDYNDDEYSYEMEEDEEADSYSMYQDLFDSKDLPTGVEVSMEGFPDSAENPSGSSKKPSSAKTGSTSDVTGSSSSKKEAKGGGIHTPLFTSDVATPIAQPWKVLPHNPGGVTPSSGSDTVMGEALVQAPSGSIQSKYRSKVDELLAAPDPSRVKKNMEEYLKDFVFFKRFDIVEDFSDHKYASKGTSTKQHSKQWVRSIREEWKILDRDLPEMMIFVRAYESRMDLMRAVIIGPQGTPYHDGLFFFDIFFPDTYPSVPPHVHYHSGGLRINPNLYNCGKVCLSLLGTWPGHSEKEKWIPNVSTMLQVLVSIQALILNEKPYYNEPGNVSRGGSLHGESQSKAYSENTFLYNLKTMVYTMRRPPKYFENFAYGHFYGVANYVLKACHAYRNGAPVGAKLKGDVEDVGEKSNRSSPKFRQEVSTFVETVLLREFIILGVLGLEAEPEEEEKPTETNNVAETSTGVSNKTSTGVSNKTRSRSKKRDRASSS